MSEILAPAGGKESALAAISHGADAIYLGLDKFSARSSAENFDEQALEEILNLAHLLGVRVHVAMNTLIKEDEIDNFLEQIVRVWNFGVDAFIISDIFLGKLIKENCPEIVLHLSTQAGVCNEYGAILAKRYGFSRVVLARETPLSEIKKITRIIETEVFIHGALCTCYSGQCYLSSFAGGNSGNRGRCKQPCRKLYSIDREGFDEPSYKLSLSDLSVSEKIFDLIDAGVTSFKIEGRMRGPEYVAAACDYFCGVIGRTKVDPIGSVSALKRTYNRGNFTTGLAFGQSKNFISSQVQGHIGEYIGTVKVLNTNYYCVTRDKFSKGDCFKILRGGSEVGGAWFVDNTRDGVQIMSRQKLRNGDKVFITTDTKVIKSLLSKTKFRKVTVSCKFLVGQPAEVTIDGNKYLSDFILERADKHALTRDDIISNFMKKGSLPFEVEFGSVECEQVFLATSQLNAFRREVFTKHFDSLIKATNTQYSSISKPKITAKPVKNAKTSAITTTFIDLKADIGILKLDSFTADIEPLIGNFAGEKFLYVPPFMTSSDIDLVKAIISKFDGIYSDGILGFELSRELNKKFFAGFGLNISNSIDIEYCEADYICLSKELTIREATPLMSENTFYLKAGDIKVMDIIYCPFEKRCKECDRRNLYTLTDESRRAFPLRRYFASECRFELFNCASLISDTPKAFNSFFDCTLSDHRKVIGNGDLATYFKNYTRGHSVNDIK